MGVGIWARWAYDRLEVLARKGERGAWDPWRGWFGCRGRDGGMGRSSLRAIIKLSRVSHRQVLGPLRSTRCTQSLGLWSADPIYVSTPVHDAVSGHLHYVLISAKRATEVEAGYSAGRRSARHHAVAFQPSAEHVGRSVSIVTPFVYKSRREDDCSGASRRPVTEQPRASAGTLLAPTHTSQCAMTMFTAAVPPRYGATAGCPEAWKRVMRRVCPNERAAYPLFLPAT